MRSKILCGWYRNECDVGNMALALAAAALWDASGCLVSPSPESDVVEASAHSPGAGLRVHETMIAAQAITTQERPQHDRGVEGLRGVSFLLGHPADLRSATCKAGPRRCRRC
jgi:hypothetical protein